MRKWYIYTKGKYTEYIHEKELVKKDNQSITDMHSLLNNIYTELKEIKEVLESGKGNSGRTESEASDSSGGATKTKTVD